MSGRLLGVETPRPHGRWFALMIVAVMAVMSGTSGRELTASQETARSAPTLTTAIAALGHLDYDTRTAAARLVRRSDGAQAVPALLKAAAEHADGYVRFRALVLLTGFDDPRTDAAMREALTSPNDRLRTVAYHFFERRPDPKLVPTLLAALESEIAEFVRPALVRALAAHGTDARVQAALVRDVGRGEDLFRSAVIEALGEHRAAYAIDPIVATATLDGPLQDDAVLALGRIGDQRVLKVLSELQGVAPQERQPAIAAAICLLGVNCDSHEAFLVRTLRYTEKHLGFQPLLRSAATGLAALAVSGRESALMSLFEIGIPSRDPTRAPMALAVATVALRNARLMLTMLGSLPDRKAALTLLAEGFDMLEEDLEKERFFALARRTYWASAEGSLGRMVMERLIADLDF